MLLAELGYPTTDEVARARLQHLAQTGTDHVCVAVAGEHVLGFLSLHWTTMLHHSDPVARITALAVEPHARRLGIGRALVEHAMSVAAEAGCSELELTTRLDRAEAHQFYTALGFQRIP